MTLEPFQIVRELIAGSLFFLNIYLVYAFTLRAGICERLSWAKWKNDVTVQAATMLALYFLGAMVLRGWEWSLALLTNLNIQFDYPKADYLLWLVRNSWPVTILAGAVTIVGGLGIVYAFTPDKHVRGALILVCLFSVLLPFAIFLAMHGWPG